MHSATRSTRPTLQIPFTTVKQAMTLHFELSPGYTACDQAISDHLSVTDDVDWMEARSARCKACWRVVERERGQ